MSASVYPARSRYYNLGLNLGVDSSTLDSIKLTVRDQSDKGLREVLLTWLRQNGRHSWKDIVDALKAPSVGVDVTTSH